MKKIIFLFPIILVLCLATATAFAQEDVEYIEPTASSNSIGGAVGLGYTYDTRDMNRLALDTNIQLPYRFSYYSYFNFNSQMAVDGANFEIDNFYSEHNLWWNPYEPIPVDLALQYVIAQGAGNDMLQLGLRWRLSDTVWIKNYCEMIHLTLSSQVHPLQTDLDASAGWGFSFEHRWSLQILPERFSKRFVMSGFLDHYLNYGGPANGNHHSFVVENELAVRVWGNFSALAAYRFSDYDVRQHGLAFGAKYVVNF
ncbi:MAG: hypothetical protein ACD_62C00547G0006 [uncultured bacterium]|nr:MAG: hypothetical protein ACD_62C00547G0006 [uncultured bacterium]HLD45159.1 hypothetical protein [bacterium]